MTPYVYDIFAVFYTKNWITLNLALKEISNNQEENCEANLYAKNSTKIFKNLVIKLAYKIKHTLKIFIPNPKEKSESFEESVIYEINFKGCSWKYYS